MLNINKNAIPEKLEVYEISELANLENYNHHYVLYLVDSKNIKKELNKIISNLYYETSISKYKFETIFDENNLTVLLADKDIEIECNKIMIYDKKIIKEIIEKGSCKLDILEKHKEKEVIEGKIKEWKESALWDGLSYAFIYDKIKKLEEQWRELILEEQHLKSILDK